MSRQTRAVSIVVAFVALLLEGCLSLSGHPPLEASQVTSRHEAWQAVPPELKQQLEADYDEAGDTRPVFERYFEALGPLALLGFLEWKVPRCHGEAHDLGQVLLSRQATVDQALDTCGDSCSRGCMHGVIAEALRRNRHGAADALMADCQGTAWARRYTVGNCAHALGHGLLIRHQRNLDVALQACANIHRGSLHYYCATGVFMEYRDGQEGVARTSEDSDRLCQRTRFPAACYRYLLEEVTAGWSVQAVVRKCQQLGGAARLGCFHGLGAMAYESVAEDPVQLLHVCRYGTSEDQAVCIEGAIERLASHDEGLARRACPSLPGRGALLCEEAASGKLYRLDKPTMSLYLGEG